MLLPAFLIRPQTIKEHSSPDLLGELCVLYGLEKHCGYDSTLKSNPSSEIACDAGTHGHEGPVHEQPEKAEHRPPFGKFSDPVEKFAVNCSYLQQIAERPYDRLWTESLR